jgi:AbrB family looped-hinge helix DNA binding protein
MQCIFFLVYFSAVVKLDGFLNGEQAMETKATSKGQITIPSEIRKQLGIKDGTYLHVDMNDAKQIVLTPVTREFVRSLRGKYKGMGLMKALIAEKKLL